MTTSQTSIPAGFVEEFGYTVIGRAEDLMLVERDSSTGRQWYPTFDEAETARKNDLRFRLPTAVVRRLVSAPEVVGEPSRPSYWG